MIIGPLLIFSCPHCHTSVMQASHSSNNDIGAVYYSDGSLRGPMYAKGNKVARCAKCASFYWLNKDNQVASIDWEDLPDECPVPFAEALSLSACKQALESSFFQNREEELYLRNHYWQLFNHTRRLKQPDANNKSLFAFWEQNCRALIQLQVNQAHSTLIVAELHRNLGEFDNCRRLLSTANSKDQACIREQLLQACDAGNRYQIALQGPR